MQYYWLPTSMAYQTSMVLFKSKQMFASCASAILIDGYTDCKGRGENMTRGKINVTLMRRKARLLSKEGALCSSKHGNNGSLMHFTPSAALILKVQ